MLFIWSQRGGKSLAIDRRQQISDAATKSFSLYGYKATTMDQVAKLGNVGKGTIYTFFKNKEELFDVIITDLITNMKQVATEAIDPSLPFKNNVHQALYGMLEFRLKHQLTIKLFQEGREIGTPIVQDVMRQVENEILAFIKDKDSIDIDNKQNKHNNTEIKDIML